MMDLETMTRIQAEKRREAAAGSAVPLDEEGQALAEHKRLTFDIPAQDLDPLR